MLQRVAMMLMENEGKGEKVLGGGRGKWMIAWGFQVDSEFG
jgi:hypothetical protein